MEPFYAAGPRGSGDLPRLLLLSYHFPPGQGAGALRWQKLARHVASRGRGLDVVTLSPSELPSADATRLDELPPGTRVYGAAGDEPPLDRLVDGVWGLYRRVRDRRPRAAARGDAPAGAAAAAGRSAASPRRPESLGRAEMEGGWRTVRDVVRGYHAWREYARDGRWARAAARVALRVVEAGPHEAVISCGPPHMAHVGGLAVARRTGLPLVVDMRDPWSLVQRLPESVASATWLRLARHYESRVVSAARLVVANTAPAAEALRAAYPEAADRIIAVMNGYDDDPYPRPPERERFTIAYAGTIYLDRDPSVLFRSVFRVVRELGLSPADLAIELMGHVRTYDGRSVQAIADEHGLSGFLEVHPPGPRAAAMGFLASAHLLVSLPQDSDLAIPSKVFEYMKHEAWVLALAEPTSATGSLLAATDADVVVPGDLEGMTAAIRRRFEAYRSGERGRALAASHPEWSRARQAELLFDELERRAC